MSHVVPELMEKLADPWDHSVLAEGQEAGAHILVSESGRRYPLNSGTAWLMPSPKEVSRYFGARNYKSWRRLQDEAEKSYAVLAEGHFSVDSYKPAIDFGEILASLAIHECLDIGCGALPLPAYMKSAKKTRFFGIDPMDLPASREFPFVRAYGDFLPFKAESFDGVAFPSSLDHCLNPLKALEEAFRVLRPGGTLCVWEKIRKNDPNFRRWVMESAYFMAQYNKQHNWAFDRKSLRFVVAKAGFSELEWQETSSPNVPVLIARKGATLGQIRREN